MFEVCIMTDTLPLASSEWIVAWRRAWEQAIEKLGSFKLREERERAMPFRRPTREEHAQMGKTIREASVLWLLFPDAERNWRGTLMLRTPDEGVHGGQISIPGGEKEPSDACDLATALREFQEEMGVHVAEGDVIGRLQSLYIPPSQFVVEPFVAVCDQVPEFVPDALEVAEVLCPPLDELCDDSALVERLIEVSPGLTRPMPCFEVDGHRVWGATALMLTEFGAIWREIQRNDLIQTIWE